MTRLVIPHCGSDPIRVVDADQVLLDLDEAQAQLAAVAKAAEIVEELRAEVAAKKRDLNDAKQRLQTAEWNVVAVARSICDRRRRRAKR